MLAGYPGMSYLYGASGHKSGVPIPANGTSHDLLSLAQNFQSPPSTALDAAPQRQPLAAATAVLRCTGSRREPELSDHLAPLDNLA